MTKYIMGWVWLFPLIASAENFYDYEEYQRSGRLAEYCENIEDWYQSTTNPWYKPEYHSGVKACYKRSDEYKNIPMKERNQALKAKFDFSLYGRLIIEAARSGEPVPEEVANKLIYSSDPQANEMIIKSRINKAYKDYYANEERDHILRPYLEEKFQEIWKAYLENNQIEEADRVFGDFYEFMCTRKQYRCSKEDNDGNFRKPYGRMKEVFNDDKVKGYQRYLESQKEPEVEKPLSTEELKKQREDNAKNAVKNLITPKEYNDQKQLAVVKLEDPTSTSNRKENLTPDTWVFSFSRQTVLGIAALIFIWVAIVWRRYKKR